MSQNTSVATKNVVSDRSFSTTFTVEHSPEAVYAAVNNVRAWWSDSIKGKTDELGQEFKYHFQDLHSCTMKITELIPGKRVVWHVLENSFSFTKDKTEWINTDVIFEISNKGGKTQLQFTHHGLVPEYECFEACQEGWTTYITGSLRSLITTGKGRPNTGEAITINELKLTDESFTVAFYVDESPETVFAAINKVEAWWSGEPGVEGSAGKLGDEFTYRYGDVHYSKQRVVELIPGKKVVWRVTEAQLNFVKDKGEWKDTEIVFDITPKKNKTEVRFTHVGLIPKCECFEDCSGAWGLYANNSLRSLITSGKGLSFAF